MCLQRAGHRFIVYARFTGVVKQYNINIITHKILICERRGLSPAPLRYEKREDDRPPPPPS